MEEEQMVEDPYTQKVRGDNDQQRSPFNLTKQTNQK